MILSRPDLRAPIIPDKALGGIFLRTRLVDIQDLIIGIGKGSYELFTPVEARYRLGAGEIEVGVDVRNGKVARLIAHQGYRGALFGSILVGMKVEDAIKNEPRLYYDEAEETILCRGLPGVALDVLEVDPEPELVPMMQIHAISITPKEMHTESGQAGHW